MTKLATSDKSKENHISITPPLKWAGGKRWFAANHQNLFPTNFKKYIEPFFGSGAVFFSLKPYSALISDLNPELINLYEVIRDEPSAIFEKLKEHQKRHDSEYYYKIRELAPRNRITRAARTLYLNRTCWNGLYRVNLAGQFNVPKGTKDNVIIATDDFEQLSTTLKSAEIKCQDFEASIDTATEGDFIFVDPPYTVAHNNNGFIKYNQKLFKWEDQIRLRDALKKAVQRGADVLVTNAAHKSVIEIYEDFEKIIVNRAGIIAGSSSARGKFQELIAKNY